MTWVIIFCSFLGVFCLLVGGLAGMAWEQHCANRDLEREEREEAMARRTYPVYHQPASDPFAGIREAGRRAWAIQQQRAGQASIFQQAMADGAAEVNRALYEESDEEWFGTHVVAVADEIIAWAHAASNPGSSG